jgi:hypothetical protein
VRRRSGSRPTESRAIGRVYRPATTACPPLSEPASPARLVLVCMTEGGVVKSVLAPALSAWGIDGRRAVTPKAAQWAERRQALDGPAAVDWGLPRDGGLARTRGCCSGWATPVSADGYPLRSSSTTSRRRSRPPRGRPARTSARVGSRCLGLRRDAPLCAAPVRSRARWEIDSALPHAQSVFLC